MGPTDLENDVKVHIYLHIVLHIFQENGQRYQELGMLPILITTLDKFWIVEKTILGEN